MRQLSLRSFSMGQLLCRWRDTSRRLAEEDTLKGNIKLKEESNHGLPPPPTDHENRDAVSKRSHEEDREDREDREVIESSTEEKQETLLEEMTQLSIATFPSDKNAKDSALHIACHQHYTDDLILDILLKEDPNLVFWENAQNELPLHSAMRDVKETKDSEQRGVSDIVLDKLLSLNENAVRHLNYEGCLPIHVACQHGAVNESAIKKLLKIYPESVMVQSNVTLPFDETLRVQDNPEPIEDDRESKHFGLFQKLLDHFQNPIGICCDRELHSSETDDLGPMETNFSPLHLAILNNASPNIVDHILATGDANCLNLKTSEGRTAMDIAKTIPDAEDSIQVMQSYKINAEKKIKLQAFTKSVMDLSCEDKIDAKLLWKKAGKAVIFVNRLGLLLGPSIEEDDSIGAPDDFVPPTSLERSCLDVTLPVGFHRLRWALLNSQSTFYKSFHELEMGYTKIDISPWSKFDTKIGQTTKSIYNKDFIGAIRTVNFLMPKSGLVQANMAYTTETIVESTDYCIAIKRVAKNPDVPFGETFEAHCLDVFINTGSNTCRMITSSEAMFYGKPPFIAWKIRTAMYDGITSKSVALGNAICEIKQGGNN